jgi:GH25 family lysozyme M1 (1,4-beta-N-acetylmuramidase)
MVLEGTDENGKAKYREATYGDDFNPEITKFYVVGQIKYTGWQTIEGATYYYTADGKVVTGSQIILGVRYEFNSDGTLNTGNGVLGIDVSKWNGNIDWTKVKNAGVKFVIIRVGYRGSTQGALVDDSKFASNIKGATAAGLKVGVYFFSQAVDEVEAVYEASMVLDRISGYKISYPVYIDVESSGGRGDTIDKDTRTAVIKAFCATIASKGYAAGVYSNKTWLTSRMDVSALGAYKIWLAQYATEVTYSGRYEMWQYTAKGSINGISGNVDLDLSYMSY